MVDGLYNRYIIKKSNGDSVSPVAKYFVLRLDEYGSDKIHVNACRKAALTYANEIENHLPELAKDLRLQYSEEI